MAKNSPNLPASSRMQMPSGGGKLGSTIKETGGMKGVSKGGTTKKVMAKAAKGGKMAKKGY
jgi:hypothetical protein